MHFGIGDATVIDSVEIHWPSGAVEKVKLPSLDHIFTVEEGKGVIDTLVVTAPNKQKTDPAKPTHP